MCEQSGETTEGVHFFSRLDVYFGGNLSIARIIFIIRGEGCDGIVAISLVNFFPLEFDFEIKWIVL